MTYGKLPMTIHSTTVLYITALIYKKFKKKTNTMDGHWWPSYDSYETYAVFTMFLQRSENSSEQF